MYESRSRRDALPIRTLHDALRLHAERTPAALALLAPARAPVSFEQLVRQAGETARHLHDLGIERETTIAMVMPDGAQMASAFLRVSAAAACMPIHPALRAAEIERLFAGSPPGALLVPAGSSSPAVRIALRDRIPVIESDDQGALAGIVARVQPRNDQPGPDDPLLVLHTSGTSAGPKAVTLRHRHVLAAARAIGEVLELAPADRCLSVMPLFHIHGLSAIVASLLAGASAVCPTDFSAPRFFEQLDEFQPTWYTASPAIHRAIVDEARRHRSRPVRSSLRFIRSASSAMPRDLAHELEELFQVPLIEAYGMTEAGPQIASQRLPPCERKRGSVGRAAGPAVAIFDAAGDALPANTAGEIAIRGENVCSEGWLRTGDAGYLDDDGDLFVTGRLIDVINRGGEKFAPQEIEAALIEHPAVREAVAFAIPHPTLGEQAAAAVVLQSEGAAAPRELREHLAERLAPFKVPQPILIVDRIPAGSTGKLQRRRLPELLAATPRERPGDAVENLGRTAQQLQELLAEVLGKTLGIHDDFFESGGDSLSATRVVTRINTTFGTALTPGALFDHPTLADLGAWLESSESRTQPTIPRAGRSGEGPLSFGQQRLWILDQLDPGNAAYNMQLALRCSGTLNTAALERSLEEIRTRHEALRTIFPSRNGEPFARVLDPAPFRLAVVSLTRVPPAEREAELRRVAEEERGRPFLLAREAPFRPLLAQVSASDHVLFLTMHHIVSDGWSTTVLVRELSALYAAFHAGEPSPLAELPIQFAGFVEWQRTLLDDGARDAQLSYWRNALEGSGGTATFPADRPRPTQTTHAGASFGCTLRYETVAQLKALGRAHDATLFMVMFAAFQTLLARYSGQEDVSVGIPIANRTHPATEHLIGFFANTLVIRGDLSGDPPFLSHLHRVRRAADGAFANQDLPFEELVDALRPARDASRTPLFQVMFAFQNFPSPSGTFARDLDVAPYSALPSTAKFDVTLYVSETTDGLRTNWQYSTELFDETTIAGVAASYEALLESIVANPEYRLSELSLSTSAITTTNDRAETRASASSPRAFLERFAWHVERTPDALAVRCGEDALTYRELDERSTTFASRFQRNGVRPGTLAAVCLPRAIDTPAALLGVWKAGGAYLPIDPHYPAERIAFMLNDARASVLITQRSLRDALPDCDAPIVMLDGTDDRPAAAAQDAEAPRELAYVLYTSGSTGPPKGVMISHQNIAHYLDAMSGALGVTDCDRHLHTASNAFSSAMRQFLLPLSCGAAVVIATVRELRDPLALLERVKREGVTIIDLVPSYWRQMMRSLTAAPREDRESLLENDLRLVLTASEPLLSDLPEQWFASGHRARVVNMYGQTETTGIVAMHEVSRESGQDVSPVPVGRPIAGVTIDILDSAGRPVPDGVIGELHVSGPTAGLGYLGRAHDTAHRFSTNAASGTRRYRTGDRGRRLTNGTLVLLGRVDDQLKIRGIRVEPAEIEAALKSDPRVDECAVTARPGASGEPQLVAFVVPRRGSSHETMPVSLRAALEARLPESMVPRIELVDALPLTPTGKLDRAALAKTPVPASETRESESSVARPRPAHDPPTRFRSAAQQILAESWQRLLGRERIALHDNFFDLGGDSLLGIRMISEARAAGLRLEPIDLFRFQTLGALAEAAAGEQGGTKSTESELRITLESARAYGEEALMQAGLSREHAAAFTTVQLEASLRGQTTHNIGAIPRYARRLATNAMNARFAIRLERESTATALLDGDNGPGQLVALAAMELAMAKAKESGAGFVSVRRSNHFGAAGHYVWLAAQRGLIGLCTTNSALWLAPAGGLTPLFGTNPLAAGFPASRHHPIVLDVSMSVIAKGKVAQQLEAGRPLQPGWILDRSGAPTIDPADLVAGLGIPIGGHKGYGLALVMELLSGVLSGAGFGSDHRRDLLKRGDVPPDFGHCFIAIDPVAFLPRGELAARVDRLIDEVKGARRMEGVDEILLPGEREMRARERNLREGVPLSPSIEHALERYRREAGLRTALVPAGDFALAGS